jgi:hypothetical protein
LLHTTGRERVLTDGGGKREKSVRANDDDETNYLNIRNYIDQISKYMKTLLHNIICSDAGQNRINSADDRQVFDDICMKEDERPPQPLLS